MSASPQIIKSRHRRDKKARNSFSQHLSRFALIILTILCLIIAFSIIAISIVFANLSEELPSLQTFPILFEPASGQLNQPTRLFDRSGQHLIAILEKSNASEKEYLSIDEDGEPQIPHYLISATITSVDPGFWSNPGFNWYGFQTDYQPTLAQKLVSDNLLWDQPPSLRRSLIENILAAQVVSRYGREQIIEWYLNSAYYGQLTYGADAAARVYFGKPAADLSLAQSAILAAAAESPSLNPIDAPIAAIEAKDKILYKMLEQDLISAEQLEQALAEELTFQSPQNLSFDISPDFTKLVIEQVSEFIPSDRIFQGGLNITTSLDFDLQSQVACTTSTQLIRMTNDKFPDSGLENCEMARLLPSFQEDSNLSDLSLAASVIVMDPNNGQILAMVGGDDTDLNPNRLPGRPPGSILTPFIYLTSFSRGASPATLLWDIPAGLVENFPDVQNPDDQFHGPVSMRTALANDYIVPTLQILSQMDPDQVWHTAQQIGLNNLQFPSRDGPYLLPVEGGEASLIEVSQAYGVFASQGILAGITQGSDSAQDPNLPIDPQVIIKVEDTSGTLWIDCTGQITECHTIKRPVLSPQLAYLVTNILSDETSRWPSLGHPNPLEIGRPAAAKIGSTISNEDTWTVGYTPDLVTAVWIGTEAQNQEAEFSPNWSAGLWHAVIQYAMREQPNEEFIPPPGITTMEVCDPSGLLPTDECPHVVNEVFTNGNEPTQLDNLFKPFLINRETGRLATIFTSPALIDQKVFMVVPPVAEDWAKEANIPTIPEAYDILDINPVESGNARITSPSMFSMIRGAVPLTGRATGEDFEVYRLQIGPGLNPSTWLQIGEDVDKPVRNGELGTWKTSGLSGLYALQLIVTHQDGTVESATVQVTIDNQKPEVKIRYPEEDQLISLSEIDEITFLVDVSDDLELVEVEFLVDGDLLTTLNYPPFAAPWKTKLGEHILRVRATDRAGNLSIAQLRFVVDR